MKVEKNKVVKIHYSATDIHGNIVDSNEEFAPLEYLHGYDNILAAVEAALDGLTTGEETQFMLTPAQAYGEYDPAKLMEICRNDFPAAEELQPGDIFESFDGEELPIHSVNETTITVERNHPLAGKSLNFWVKVILIREAMERELQQGHPLPQPNESCGPGCCC